MLVRSQSQPLGKERVDSGTILGASLTSIYVPGVDRASLFGGWDRKGSSNLTGGSGSPTRTPGNQGMFYTDTNTGYVSGTIPGISTFPIVLIAAGYFSSGANSWNFMSLNPAGAGAGGARCEISLASGTEIDYVLRNNFGTTATTQGTGLSGVSTGAFFVCVAQSRSATDHNLYINGTQYTSTTNMGGITNAYTQLAIGATSTGAANPVAQLNGGVLFAAYGRIALADSLARDVSRSPLPFWQMFARQGRRYLAMAPVAAATDVIPLYGKISGPGNQSYGLRV